MKKLLFWLTLAALSLLCSDANAQYIPVTASSCIVDGSGSVIVAGTMTVIGTDSNDNPVVYRAGTTFITTTAPITKTITNGSVSSFQLADPSNSSPLNVSYRISIQDNLTKRNSLYKGVNITPNDTLIGGVFTTFNICKMNPGAGVSSFGPFTTPSLVSGDWTVTRDLFVNRNAFVAGEAAFGQTDSSGYIISAKDLTATAVSTLHVSHFATTSGAYGIEEHGYNSCGLDCLGIAPTPGLGASNLLVLHDYSQASGTAMQIDSTGSRTILTLKNAINSVTSFSTKGTSNFLDIIGFSPGSPSTPVLLMHLRNDGKFAADDSTINPGFANGMEADSATSDPRSAITVSSANSSFSAISLNETATGIYGLALTSTKNFGANITTTTDGGETLHVEKDGTVAGTVVKIINKGTGDSILVTDGTNTKWEMNAAGKLLTYNGTALTGNGALVEPATPVDVINGNASVATTTLYAVPTSGLYEVRWYAKVTQQATTSSTLGALTISYTDATDSVGLAETTAALTGGGGTASTIANGTTTSVLNGIPLQINAKAGTNIQYAWGYASSGATPMQYELHIRVLGPL